MLQNDARVTAFTVNELLRENQLDREGGENYPPPPPPPPIGVKPHKKRSEGTHVPTTAYLCKVSM